MLLHHDKAKQQAEVVAAALENGDPIPESVTDGPELPDHLRFYHDAYLELSTCRQIGFGVGPIPWASVRLWASAHGLDADEFAELWQVIRTVDAAILEDMDKRNAERQSPRSDQAEHGGAVPTRPARHGAQGPRRR